MITKKLRQLSNMDILHSYTNGNTNVVLYSDGTKERTFEGTPEVIHPESIDVKITNYCDAGCSFCHETSTRAGQHGDLDKLLGVLSELPAGCEIAIGGGAAQKHPDIIPFLEKIKLQGLVANITINQKHLAEDKDLILMLIEKQLVKGVGISYTAEAYVPAIKPILQASDNVVFHLIMGINQVKDIETLNTLCQEHNKKCKVLVLGYKQFGFGINYYLKNSRIEDNKYNWFTQLALYFKKNNLTISFDNLAIKQLELRRYFTDKAWEQFYMGDDFVYTMYMDAVEQNYAPSSTSKNRVSFDEVSLVKYFQDNKSSI